MSEIPGRLYRIARAYLDAAKNRLEEIDSQAQVELQRSLNRDDIPAPPPASSSDPFARAAAKINAAQQEVAARRQMDRASDAAASSPDPVQTAYKIIGVPPGADWVTVQQAVNKLRERCSPSRFPEDSEAQAESKVILQRVEEAYQVLKNALDPTEGRFDRLEL